MTTQKQQQQSQLKQLIALGKEQGYLTYAEVNDHLPDSITDTDQVEDIIQMINDMGITVVEKAADADQLTIDESADSTDEVAAEEAAAVLASVENEPGRTTDPVRMYMREMGTVELLTREGEIEIAKRIEEGTREVLHALAFWPSPKKPRKQRKKKPRPKRKPRKKALTTKTATTMKKKMKAAWILFWRQSVSRR